MNASEDGHDAFTQEELAMIWRGGQVVGGIVLAVLLWWNLHQLTALVIQPADIYPVHISCVHCPTTLMIDQQSIRDELLQQELMRSGANNKNKKTMKCRATDE